MTIAKCKKCKREDRIYANGLCMNCYQSLKSKARKRGVVT